MEEKKKGKYRKKQHTNLVMRLSGVPVGEYKIMCIYAWIIRNNPKRLSRWHLPGPCPNRCLQFTSWRGMETSVSSRGWINLGTVRPGSCRSPVNSYCSESYWLGTRLWGSICGPATYVHLAIHSLLIFALTTLWRSCPSGTTTCAYTRSSRICISIRSLDIIGCP